MFNLTRQFDLKYKEIALALGLTNVQIAEKKNREKLNKLNFSRYFSPIFSAVASPVQEWLKLQFSSRADTVATNFEKIARRELRHINSS